MLRLLAATLALAGACSSSATVVLLASSARADTPEEEAERWRAGKTWAASGLIGGTAALFLFRQVALVAMGPNVMNPERRTAVFETALRTTSARLRQPRAVRYPVRPPTVATSA